MSPQPLSVQLWTVRDSLAADPAATFERLAAIGFTRVEPFDFVERADLLADLVPQYGITPSSAHANMMDRDVVPVVQAAQKLGVTTLIEPYVDPARWADSDEVVAMAHELNRVARIAADLGITVGYHNHHFELQNSVDGTSALEAFADNLDDGVVLEVDTYWAAVGGVEPVGLLGRLGERVQFIHVKDGDVSLDTMKQLPAGSGAIPVLEVLAAAPQAVRIVEFDDYAGDVFDGIAQSVAFLTANGETL